MKTCPTCNRPYADDTLNFCLMDGSVLSAAYDPQATYRMPPARVSAPQSPETLPGRPKAADTIQSPLHPTPSPLPPAFVAPPYQDQRAKGFDKRWLALPLAVLFIGLLGGGVLLVVLGTKKKDSEIRRWLEMLGRGGNQST